MDTPFRFSTQLKVRFNETDMQGHVNFAWYLNYFDVALIEYLRALDQDYQQLQDHGLDLLYVSAHADYHSPSYFDETLKVYCRTGNIGKTSIRFDFKIDALADQRHVASGTISVVVVDRQTRTKLRVPDSFRKAIHAYEGDESMHSARDPVRRQTQ